METNFQPCITEPCDQRVPKATGRFVSLMPRVSFLFFVFPIVWVMFSWFQDVKLSNGIFPTPPGLFSRSATIFIDSAITPGQPGAKDLPAAGSHKILVFMEKSTYKAIFMIIFAGFLSNLARLYLSMWLTESIHWVRTTSPTNKSGWVGWERWLRWIAMISLYLSGVFLAPGSKMPFEYLLFLCYFVCLCWDLGAKYLENSFYTISNDTAMKALKMWTRLDFAGLFATTVYLVLQYSGMEPIGMFFVLGGVSLVFIALAIIDFFFVGRANINGGEVNLYGLLWKDKPILIS